MSANQTGRQTNPQGPNQPYYGNTNQQQNQQQQQVQQQQQQQQQLQQMNRNPNQPRPMNPNQQMQAQTQNQQRMGPVPGQQMTPQTMPPFPAHLMNASKKPRYFMALFDYDPATMSPNPDACEEELPFNEGDTIRVSDPRTQVITKHLTLQISVMETIDFYMDRCSPLKPILWLF